MAWDVASSWQVGDLRGSSGVYVVLTGGLMHTPCNSHKNPGSGHEIAKFHSILQKSSMWTYGTALHDRGIRAC